MRGVRSVQNDLTAFELLVCMAVVHVSRRKQRQRAVAVLMIVPVEKRLAKFTRVRETSERLRKLGLILQRLEVRFDVRIVVGNVWPRVRFGHPQIRKQKGNRLGSHGTAAVGVNGEFAWIDALFADGFLDKNSRQLRTLAIGDHPAHDIAAVDVDNHVEVVVGPLLRAMQFGDIPGVHLTRPRRAELGFYVGRTHGLIAPLADFADIVQDAIHRRHRAMPHAFVQQRSVNVRHAAVHETFLVNRTQDHGALRIRERQG